MHPNPAFRWEDRDAMRDMVRTIGFGALFAATPDGPRVAHLPVVWLDDETIGFHIARGNALTRHLDGATALFAVQGPDGYVSPEWYGLGPQEVPTWNYIAIELEGVARRMDDDALLAQSDLLTAENEARLAPKPPWTRDKVDPARITAMMRGIYGFSMRVQAWRGTLKLAQHKPEAVRLAAADGLSESGRTAIAGAMRAWR